MTRTAADRCPGVLRPWHADDGLLVRIRVPGGRLSVPALRALADLCEEYGDGAIRLTSRANVQLRAVAADGDRPSPAFVTAVANAGLLPSPAHDLVRNIACSPLTGRLGGHADLGPLVRALDEALCAEAALAELPGKFLFALDDGTGTATSTPGDLTAVAVDASHARVVVGDGLAYDMVPLGEVVPTLLDLAHRFLAVRGTAWHVRELPERGAEMVARPAPTAPAEHAPVPLGQLTQDDGRYATSLTVPDGVLTADAARRAVDAAVGEVVLTPDRGLILPDLPSPLELEL